MISHVYNIITRYHYYPPFEHDVPEGKFFNPYFDRKIIWMPPQLYDGMIEYEDGTTASAPQMAHDVSEYLMFLSRDRIPDTKVIIWYFLIVTTIFYFISYFYTKYLFVNILSERFDVYAIKNVETRNLESNVHDKQNSKSYTSNSHKLLMIINISVINTKRNNFHIAFLILWYDFLLLM